MKIVDMKITYIFGAGASHQGLPLASKLSDAISAVAKDLEKRFNKEDNYFDFNQEVIENLQWLREESRETGTVDTLAKEYFITGKLTELKRLKKVLVAYFLLEQLLYKKKDDRYRSFLASILGDQKLFPENIKIINWNYDLQFQLASLRYGKEEFHAGTSTTITRPGLLEQWPSIGIPGRDNSKELNIVHMNGIAGYFKDIQTRLTHSILNEENPTINTIYDYLSKGKYDVNELMSFAFEAKKNHNGEVHSERLNLALEMIKGSDILIAIGYSFPHENYNFDHSILNQVYSKLNPNIYIQNSKFNVDQFEEDFELNNVKLLDNTEQFYLPRNWLKGINKMEWPAPSW